MEKALSTWIEEKNLHISIFFYLSRIYIYIYSTCECSNEPLGSI